MPAVAVGGRCAEPCVSQRIARRIDAQRHHDDQTERKVIRALSGCSAGEPARQCEPGPSTGDGVFSGTAFCRFPRPLRAGSARWHSPRCESQARPEEPRRAGGGQRPWSLWRSSPGAGPDAGLERRRGAGDVAHGVRSIRIPHDATDRRHPRPRGAEARGPGCGARCCRSSSQRRSAPMAMRRRPRRARRALQRAGSSPREGQGDG